MPVPNESALRNRDWVEGNLKKVDKATGGKVSYVYVPNTSFAGHQYFKPYIYPQMRKEAVIAGRDPQLEKAIEVALAELKKNPPKTPKRPADAIRGKTLRGTVIKR